MKLDFFSCLDSHEEKNFQTFCSIIALQLKRNFCSPFENSTKLLSCRSLFSFSLGFVQFFRTWLEFLPRSLEEGVPAYGVGMR